MNTLKNSKRKSILARTSYAMATLCTLGVATAWGNNLTVNNLTEVIASGDGQCSLQEAVINVNTNSDTTGGDCAAGAGTDTISFATDGTILLSSTLNVSDVAGLTIDSSGHNITLSGNSAVRVLLVNPNASLTVKNLTVADGFDTSIGGGIFNQFGTLNVIGCTFLGNSTKGFGGGIANRGNFGTTNPGGILTVINSTFSGNSAFYGGAISNGSGSTINLNHTTVVGNSAVTPLCTGICTLSLSGGGGVDNSGIGTLILNNSIVAGNTNIKKSAAGDTVSPSDITGSVASGGYNIVGSGGLQNGINGNIVGADVTTVLNTSPTDNGGPTQTFALLPDSPALNIAAAANCPATDQRGTVRPQGTGCDIGAFEAAVTADLAVTETVSPNPVMLRDALTWTISITNNGAIDATGVKVIDTLPSSGLSSISASASQGSCGAPTNGTITCALGSLANTSSASILVRGIPSKTGTLFNLVKVDGDQSDNQLANNTATQSVTVQTLLCNGVKPTLVGTPGSDKMNGTKGRDVIHGLGGNDIISGGNDNDIICGGEGLDSLNGDGGKDILDGGAGTDSCNGGLGKDTATDCEAKISIP